ncbi:MAG: SH3 domain-containing protein [Alphaproteobacteria bacterium]
MKFLAIPAALLAASLLLAEPVAAQTPSPLYAFEVHYRVATISRNGRLNVRQAPSLGAAIAGRLSNGTGGILLQRCTKNAKWCEVAAGPLRGWVDMRYLRGYAD